LEHDANAAAVGEYRFGAARGAAIAVLVAVGTGIGAALLIDGRLFRGAFGVAPELGHLTVVPDGRPCPCGKKGCWERYCSGTALAATTRELLAAPTARSELSTATAITGRSVAEAARRGDPVATAAMADFAHWLGNGLSLVADAYDPAVIVLGGGVSESAELFLEQADARYLASITGAGFRPRAQLKVAALGDLAGIVGAAVLAAEHAAVTVPPG
jgi:glucokinase